MYKEIKDLEFSDILLCSGNTKYISDKIKKETSSNYTHAAIYIGNKEIAHSTMAKGVHTDDIQNLIEGSNYIAILRQKDLWSYNRCVKLKAFISKSSSKSLSNYNFKGIKDFKKNKLKHIANNTNELDEYFESGIRSNKTDKFYCSQFIMECLCAIEYLDDSVLVAYGSHVVSPSDLINQNNCGFFYGFINPKKNTIPNDDEMLFKDKYEEIFN